MGLRLWFSSWLGDDKLEKNLLPKQKNKIIGSSSEPTSSEEETKGTTYDNIVEALRQEAVTNESISMVANSYVKGVYGAKVSIQNTSADENINKEIEKLINLFSKQKNLMLNEENHLNAFLRQIVEAFIRDGGFIIRKHKISKATAKIRNYEVPYKIELLEITDIDFEKNSKENKIFNGIQINNQKKPIRVYFKGGKSVAFKNIIMFGNKTRISQLNAVSKLYPSLQTMGKQQAHAKAEVDNAIEQAKVSDVYKTKIAEALKIETSGDFDSDMANSGAVTKEIDSRRPDKDAKIISTDEEYVRLDRGAYSSAYETINDSANTRIAAGTGLTKDEFTNDLSKLTFHGGKVADIRNREIFDITRDDIDQKVIIPIFEDMIKWLYILGEINIKPNSENIKLEIIKKPRKSAQPDKDATTYDKNYKNGFQTYGDIVKELTGENLKDFLKRREEEELLRLDIEINLAKKRKELEDMTSGEKNNEQ